MEGFPDLYGVPTPYVEVHDHHVVVEIEDSFEGRDRRTRAVFEVFQAVRVITEDCFIYPVGLFEISLGMVEVVDSPWIEELKADLARHHPGAVFMEQAKHFLIPTRYKVVEVVGWRVTWEIFYSAP